MTLERSVGHPTPKPENKISGPDQRVDASTNETLTDRGHDEHNTTPEGTDASPEREKRVNTFQKGLRKLNQLVRQPLVAALGGGLAVATAGAIFLSGGEREEPTNRVAVLPEASSTASALASPNAMPTTTLEQAPPTVSSSVEDRIPENALVIKGAQRLAVAETEFIPLSKEVKSPEQSMDNLVAVFSTAGNSLDARGEVRKELINPSFQYSRSSIKDDVISSIDYLAEFMQTPNNPLMKPGSFMHFESKVLSVSSHSLYPGAKVIEAEVTPHVLTPAGEVIQTGDNKLSGFYVIDEETVTLPNGEQQTGQVILSFWPQGERLPG